LVAIDAHAVEAALDRLIPRLLDGATGVADVARLSGGASQETWAFAAQTDDGKRGLILRRAPRNGRVNDGAVGLENEPPILSRCRAAGVPVPEVVHILVADDGLGTGYIMTRAEGEAIPRRLLNREEYAAVRPTLAGRFGEILATIHAADVSGLHAVRSSFAAEGIAFQRSRLARYGIDSPIFELAMVWLADNMPHAPAGGRLVHGDFRNGNIMVTPTGVSAVLDWELAHIGDPMEDLGWLCMNSWRFGHTAMPAGGFGSREALFEGYRRGGGIVDADAVRFWEVFGSLRWGITCASMAAVFASGQDASVERAMIARRVSETQADLMNLIAPRI